jgi:hypothetical protein
MNFDERLIDLIVLLESEEQIMDAGKILEMLAKEYAFKFELTVDGNWIFSSGEFVFEVMFDSSRGGDIPIDVAAKGKSTTLWEDPHLPRKILHRALAFMKTHGTYRFLPIDPETRPEKFE